MRGGSANIVHHGLAIALSCNAESSTSSTGRQPSKKPPHQLGVDQLFDVDSADSRGDRRLAGEIER